jgi:hypothetical protein
MLCTVQLALAGCAGLTPKPAQNVQLTNPQSITVIIPNDKMVDSSKIARVDFDDRWRGLGEEQEKIVITDKTNNNFKVGRRSYYSGGTAGSGVTFTVNHSVETSGDTTVVKYQPTEYRTDQQGLVLPLPVPNFTVQNLTEYLIKQPVYYNLEINSQYNTESIFSNFVRLVERAQFRQGEKDPVTGKIFKDRFAISYKNKKVYFTLETFPYRNGSKVIVHLVVPGSLTSDNVVDFGIILNDIKTQLEGVANS